MATKVYGASDDLVEFEGDVYGEVGFYSSDDDKTLLLFFSDGTILEAKYGKVGLGVWAINVFNKGAMFSHIDLCTDEDASPHSDVVHFNDGLKWAYAARNGKK